MISGAHDPDILPKLHLTWHNYFSFWCLFNNFKQILEGDRKQSSGYKEISSFLIFGNVETMKPQIFRCDYIFIKVLPSKTNLNLSFWLVTPALQQIANFNTNIGQCSYINCSQQGDKEGEKNPRVSYKITQFSELLTQKKLDKLCGTLSLRHS